MLDDMVRDHQDRMCHSHDSSFLASAPRQTMILGRQVGVATTCRRMGSLHQSNRQGSVTMAGCARVVLPSAFIIAWGDTCPSRPGGWQSGSGSCHFQSRRRSLLRCAAPLRESCPADPLLLQKGGLYFSISASKRAMLSSKLST